jgi:transcription initiation factor TFIIE subunit alpha
MSDLTVYAEALIATVARAFYSDDIIVVVDTLIRDKFLRDDDMAPRLTLPARKLRATLQFLQEEHLVYSETVDDLAQGGSQATKFYYLDYNRAVHSIRLRLHLLRKKLEQDELRARSSSFYLCPGYKIKRCNGRYTEEEAQQVLEHSTGLFLCRECSMLYQNDPNKPSIDTYTLQLVDNTKDLKQAVDNLRRVNVQMSAKYIGNDQLRAGVYDLVQKVRAKGKIITSNLPSENFALGIGSKRLAGTGRTAGIKAKKLEQTGVAQSADQALKYLVGGGGVRNASDAEFIFLKNAMGQEVQFTVERGGGARAQILATRKRRKRKLMDAAASRIGISLPLHMRIQEEKEQRKRAEEEKRKSDERKGKKPKVETLEFLRDNIGMHLTIDGVPLHTFDAEEEVSIGSITGEPELLLSDDFEELRQLSEDNRRISFQTQYRLEMDRQSAILDLDDTESPQRAMIDDEDEAMSVVWEEGEKV